MTKQTKTLLWVGFLTISAALAVNLFVFVLAFAQSLILELQFNINGGDAVSTQRSVSLNYQVRQRSGQETRSAVSTHYRAVESPLLVGVDISDQPWIPLEGGQPVPFTLQERTNQGQRYGLRLIRFQVMDEQGLTSSVVSDTINLSPVLKDHEVSGALTNVASLFRYAAEQGFLAEVSGSNRCRKCQVCSNCQNSEEIMPSFNSDGSPNFVMQAQRIQNASCITRAYVRFFRGRTPNLYWRIKSVQGNQPHVHNATVIHNYSRVGKSPVFLGTMWVHTAEHLTDNPDDTRLYSIPDDCATMTAFFIEKIVLEGPEIDDFIDPQNPWKNAFVRRE